MTDQRTLLTAGLRGDLATFVQRTFQTLEPARTYQRNWHIEAIAWRLEQCFTGKIRRLVITLPPRNLKSICASVAFPAWVLGRNPSQRIICASYAAELSGKLARDCRTVMESAWYQEAFPNTRLSTEKNTEMYFATTKQGYRYSTSVSGSVTGFGGDLIICDDLLKPEDALSDTKRSTVNEWFDSTLYSRLDDKRDGVIILIMQRLHVEDLVGHVLETEQWDHLNLPAIAEEEEEIQIGDNQFNTRAAGEVLDPVREPIAVLDRMKARMGSFRFSAQYQQNPMPPEGEIIKWKWFRHYDNPPEQQTGDSIVQSWDTASKSGELSDYSVCTTWLVKGNLYYLLDVLRRKLNYPDLKKTVIEHALKQVADTIVIEDKGSGTSLIQDLQRDGGRSTPMPIAFNPETDKITRMSTQSAKIEAGHVFVPGYAPWLEDFRAEILQFPHGRHDDQVDSISQFLEWVGEKRADLFKVDWL